MYGNLITWEQKGGSLGVMCKMNELVSEKDVKALEVYLCLTKRPDIYEWQRDLCNLMHWLDITSDNFALRLKEAYPQLTMHELNFCCLKRLGYSLEEMQEVMGIKDASLRRYIYRVCCRLGIQGNKKDFEKFITCY